ncbi:hypothetical protein Slin15195_G002510 [Septoria linicola]|uniref:Adhesin domain-containing protein n=1 Tax=Septoria linicola TaxID=215465 RepID=A0A9Q9AIX2_9PEZI|nr:hypothetical protein Slin14017_G002530 [Septoria linicola]USW46932.1 hypothetical protein Slin15195_G002510 [Septoria linicola]
MANSRDHDEEYLTDPGTEEESEDESLFDEGPGDGYFQPRHHPQTQFVENSSITAEANAKAREANEQRSGGSGPAAAASPLSSAASSPRSIAWTMPAADDNAEAPPPTYESISRGNGSQEQYGSITAQSSSRHAPPFHAGEVQPQSMRDTVPPPADEESGLLGGLKSKRQGNWRQKVTGCFKPLSICNILLIVAIVAVISTVAGVTSDDYSNGDEGGGKDSTPTSPPILPAPPKYPGTPSRGSCDLSMVAPSLQLDYENLNNFTFLELMESSAYFNGAIDGQIEIQPASAPQDGDIRVWISYATSEPWHIQHSDYVHTHDSLTLQLPSLVRDGNGYERPCLGVSVRIAVKAGLRLDNWELVTGNFDVKIDDGLFNREAGQEALSHLQVSESSSFTAIRGKIASKYWSSRRTVIETSSGTISGSFALRDLLSLKSQSGTVNVDVDPKEADEDHPAPAEFIAHTSSGTVKARFPTSAFGDEIPVRDYRTRVETSSASVGGNYILGMQTNFHTHSGSLDADLLPIIVSRSSNDISHLYTSTSSASQRLTILPPYYLPEKKSFADVKSEHKYSSSSGTLRLTYPDEWEGYIEGDTSSGSVKIEGKDVERLSGEGWWGTMYQHVIARKGGEGAKGRVRFSTSSGSVRMDMGRS